MSRHPFLAPPEHEGKALGGEVTQDQVKNIAIDFPGRGKGVSKIVALQGHIDMYSVDDNGTWILSEINAGNIGGYGRVERLIGEPVFEKLFSWMTRFLLK